MNINFIDKFSGAKRKRYWFYLMLIIAFIIFAVNSLLFMSSPLLMIVCQTAITFIFIILEQSLDLGAKDIIKTLHDKLLYINELYLI